MSSAQTYAKAERRQARHLERRGRILRAVFGHSGLLVGTILFTVLVAAAIFGPLLIQHDP